MRAPRGQGHFLCAIEPFSALDEHTGNALRTSSAELLRESRGAGDFQSPSRSRGDYASAAGDRVRAPGPRIAYDGASLDGLSDAEARGRERREFRQVAGRDAAA